MKQQSKTAELAGRGGFENHLDLRSADTTSDFLAAISAAGLSPPMSIVPDDKFHRFPSDGSRGDRDGWYIFHPDRVPSGAFGCFRRDVSQKWCARLRGDLSPAERTDLRRHVVDDWKAREEQKAKVRAEARSKSKKTWDSLPSADLEHAYLAKKKVGVHGIRQDGDRLVMPVSDIDGTLHGLQFIDSIGEKRFLTGTAKKGNFHLIGQLGDTFVIAEGYATGASVHEATGQAVVVAFDAGNLEPVAEAIRRKYPDSSIIIAGDCDKSGTGQEKARAAAAASGGKVVIPEEPHDWDAVDWKGIDWNDVANSEGPEAVKAAFDAVIVAGPSPRALAPSPKAELRNKARFVRTSTTALMATVYQPIRWVVPGYVNEGLSILTGRPKLGKTWLGIDLAIAVSCGGAAMGSIICEQGDVLYIDLENGRRRIQRRIHDVFPDDRTRPDLSRLEWAHEAPSLDDGFIDALEDWRLSVPKPRLVIVDVLQRIKPPGKQLQNAYERDYAIMTGLQRWATENSVAVVVLHHTRKASADDPLEALSGSNGLPACADTILVLNRDQNGITLYVRGRDIEEKESALRFAAGRWSLVGEAKEVRRSEQRSAIIDFLTDNPEPITPTGLAAAVGWDTNNTKQLLYKMAKNGEVLRGESGYFLPGDPR